MKNINLSLSIEELNQLLNSLSKEPYVEVFQLIEKLQTQAQAQMDLPQNGQVLDKKEFEKIATPNES